MDVCCSLWLVLRSYVEDFRWRVFARHQDAESEIVACDLTIVCVDCYHHHSLFMRMHHLVANPTTGAMLSPS